MHVYENQEVQGNAKQHQPGQQENGAAVGGTKPTHSNVHNMYICSCTFNTCLGIRFRVSVTVMLMWGIFVFVCVCTLSCNGENELR